MVRIRSRTICATLAAGALAGGLPALAGAGAPPTPKDVKAHASRAENAIERAAAFLRADKPAQALKALARARGEHGRAIAAIAKLVREADSPTEKAAVATLLQQVATDRSKSIVELAKALQLVDPPAAKKTVADAVRADLRGQARATATITILLKRAPAAAKPGLQRALAAIARDKKAAAAALAKSEAKPPETPRPAPGGPPPEPPGRGPNPDPGTPRGPK